MAEPVLIVGAGPTGLTAALELARLGVAVRIVDKAAEPATTSRAIGVQARTLELMAQRGLADEMVRLGNPAHGGSVYGGGERVLRLNFDHVDSRYPYVLMLSQAETERILREAIGRHGVEIERGVELVGLAQDALSHDPSPVSAVLRHGDGRLEQATAPWLISAEGAHSLVRTTLDLQFDGHTFNEAYALGDLHLDGDLPSSDLHIFSSEHGFMALFPFGGTHFRLIASNPISSPAPGTAPSLEELQRIYDQRSHIPARLHDLTWGSWFHINSRMVPRLRVGRLLLGGDSAHIHSPAGAQGMNTGIQDMMNLGWKLARVMHGKSPEALLDTYERDRLPVMRDVLSKTENLTDLIGSENKLLRSVFNHVAPFLGGRETLQAAGTARMSQVSLGYRDSPLSANHAHAGSLQAGDRIPDRTVRARSKSGWVQKRLQELLDPSRPTLLVFHETEAGTLDPALRDAATQGGADVGIVELTAPDEAADRMRAESVLGRSSVFLARPDGYVGFAAGAHSAARQLDAYVRQFLVGRPEAAEHSGEERRRMAVG